MGDSRERLIFDTSGLNALAKDKESAVLTTCLGIGSRVRLTETNLAEVGSTPDSALRAKLLNACQRVVGAGECIGPYHWIVEQQVKLHATRPDLYTWERVDIRLRALENEVAQPQFLTDDSLAEEMYADF